MSNPIYCKDCIHYKGRKKYIVRFPMGEGRTDQYICGKFDKSVFDVNLNNDCKDFEPKPRKRGWISKLKFW